MSYVSGKLLLGLFIIIIAMFFVVFPTRYTGFVSFVQGTNSNLTIWDDTDNTTKLTYRTSGDSHTECWNKPASLWNISFYANYTNLSRQPVLDANCQIRFNETGTYTNWYNMFYNASSKLYEYYRNMTYSGTRYFAVNCTSATYDNLTTTDTIFIENTGPCIFGRLLGDPSGPLPNTTCSEDITCYYNFSANCTDDDYNDLPLSNFTASNNFTGFSIDSGTGMITVDTTSDNETGSKNVTLICRDAESPSATWMIFDIGAVNDAPEFTNLADYLDAPEDQNYYLDVEASDEENNLPFKFNATILNCTKAPWNTSNNCGLFSINTSNGEINFTPTNWDVGNYTVNFTVTDSGNTIQPYNATRSKTVIVEVINVNDPPNMTAVSNQNLCQNQQLNITINGTDIENDTLVFSTSTLYTNLTPYSNMSLFPIFTSNSSFLSNKSNPFYGVMNYTLVNSQVGNYTINITLNDNGQNGRVSQLVNFTICNINDPPELDSIPNMTAIQEEIFYYDVNATDPDQQTPYYNDVNATISFSLVNTTACSLEPGIGNSCLNITINATTGVINFTSARSNSGNYTLNISVTDGGGLVDWQLFSIRIVPDYPPSMGYVENKNGTQNQTFYFEINITDPENNTVTVSSNSTFFPIQTDNSSAPTYKGVINLTLNNSQVGNHTIRIIATDYWNRTNYTYVNFTIFNINDAPQLMNFYSCSNSSNTSSIQNQTVYEDQNYCKFVNATDPDQSVGNDSLTYAMTFINGTERFSINSSTGKINFTATNSSWLENYTVNITATDTNGSSDSIVISYVIIEVNDAPAFTNLASMNRTATENSTFYYDLNATDEEGNLPLLFNLNFINCSKKSGNNSNCSVFGINTSTGVINFTITNANDTGNYTINFTVKDNNSITQPYNATGWELVNFSITAINHAPNKCRITVTPPSPFYEGNQTNLYIDNITDIDNDTVGCTWYDIFEGIERQNGCALQINYSAGTCAGSSLHVGAIYRPNQSDSGTHIIKLIVSDGQIESTCNATVNVTNKNRSPYQEFQIANQTWNMNTENTNIQMTYYFKDYDNQNTDHCNESKLLTNDDNNFTYTIADGGHLTSYIDNSSSTVHITPTQGWYGNTWIIFNVSDGAYTITSNNVSLNVTYVESEQQQQQTGGASSGSTTITDTKTAALSVSILPFEYLASYNKTIVPIKLKNTGQVALNSILLSLDMEKTIDIVAQLNKTNISQLVVGAEESVKITITSYNLTKESYEIRFLAHASSPTLNQTSVIYLKTNPKNRTEVEEKLRLVKDLFEENPECLDLWEMISDAEKELNRENLVRAKELTDLAVKNCMDLINYESTPIQQTIPGKEEIDYNQLINVFLLLSLFSVVAYYIVSGRHKRPKQ